MIELRYESDFEIHIEQVRNTWITLINDYSLSSLGTFKNEILEELKKVKYNDLEDLLYWKQLTYDEIIDILDLNYNPSKRTSYSSKPGRHENSAWDKTLQYILPYNLNVSFTIDDNRLKSNLDNSQNNIY